MLHIEGMESTTNVLCQQSISLNNEAMHPSDRHLSYLWRTSDSVSSERYSLPSPSSCPPCLYSVLLHIANAVTSDILHHSSFGSC